MKIQACLCSILSVFLSTLTVTQQSPNYSAGTSSPASATSDPELSRPSIILSGKIVLDDGTALPGVVAVQTLCKGRRRTVTHTDASGGFSFTLIEQGSGAQSLGVGMTDASVSGTDGL